MTLLEEIPRGTFREGSIPVLETKRLALRAPRLEDAKTVATLANDRRIAENTARIPHPYKMSDAEDFIAGANKAGGEAVFLITLRDGAIVGACGVVLQQDETPELGYWLGLPFWGQGYATEALHAVIDYAFTDLSHEARRAQSKPLGLEDGDTALSESPSRYFFQQGHGTGSSFKLREFKMRRGGAGIPSRPLR